MKGALGQELGDGRSGSLWEEGSLGSGGPRRLGSFGRSGPWDGDTDHLGLARHLDAQVPRRVMGEPQGCSLGVPQLTPLSRRSRAGALGAHCPASLSSTPVSEGGMREGVPLGSAGTRGVMGKTGNPGVICGTVLGTLG